MDSMLFLSMTTLLGNPLALMACLKKVVAVSSHNGLMKHSALGELMAVDYESLPLMTRYRAADALWKHSTRINCGNALAVDEKNSTASVSIINSTYKPMRAAKKP